MAPIPNHPSRPSLELRERVHGILPPLLLALGLGLVFSTSVRAQAWDPFPKLPQGQHAAVKRDLDGPHYDTLRACLRGLDSPAKASYFAAVVAVSAENGIGSPDFDNAVPYVDALYHAWRPSRRLDPDRHILIVMALENRAVAIHPGTRWADLGFQGPQITQVIDGSRFGDIARDGDFGRALCALAEAVDRELQSLTAQAQQLRENARQALAGAQARSTTLEQQIIELGTVLPVVSRNLHDELRQVHAFLGAGRAAEDRGRQNEAKTSLDLAMGQLASIEERAAKAQNTLRNLPLRRQEIADLEKDMIAAAEGDAPSDSSRRQLESCRQELESIDGELLKGQMVGLAGVDRCFEDLRREIRLDRQFHKLFRWVLWLAVGLLLVFLLVFWVSLKRRRDRARTRMLQELETWQQNLSTAAERLLEVESQYPLYFATGTLRWTGSSQTLDQRCADAVNRLYLLYSRAYELLGEAQSLAGKASGIRAAPYDRAWNLLRETPVVFETGSPTSDQDHRRIFLPLSEEYRSTARGLLQDLDQAYGAAIDLLAEITRIDERLRDLLEEVETSASETMSTCVRREELGLPTAHLLKLLEPELARRDEARGPLRSDPLGAIAILEPCRDRLTEIHRRGELGNRIVERVRGPLRELSESLSQRIEELRREGYKVQEPGFDPDLRLARAKDQAEQVAERVETGDEDGAEKDSLDLQHNLEELREHLEATAAARQEIPRELEVLGNRTRQLEGRMPEARDHLEILRRDHDPAAFAEESDNLQALSELLGKLGDWQRYIAEDHRDERYLSALADLDTCDDLLIRGGLLVDEIVAVRSALETARQSSRDLASSLSRLLEQLPKPDTEPPGLGEDLRRLLATARDDAREALASMDQPRPHWLEIAAVAGAAQLELQRLLERTQTELGAFAEAQALEVQLRGESSSLAEQVEQETRDRPHVHAAVEEVTHRLESWKGDLDGHLLGGSELLSQGRDVQARLAWARGVFTTEMDTVRHAESEIAALRSLLDREDRRSLGYGVVTDCGEGRRALSEMQALCRSRDWESVVRRAQEALRSIEQEIRTGRREAERREEQERRRIARERAAAAALAAEVAARAAAVAMASSRSSSRVSRSSSSSSFGRSGGSSFRSSSRSGGSSW